MIKAVSERPSSFAISNMVSLSISVLVRHTGRIPFEGFVCEGVYDIVVQSAIADCIYEETVVVGACTFNQAEIVTVNVPSAASATCSIEINLFSGVAPYEYSIDGGQSFVSSNLFTGLPIGTYNVIVKDAEDICPIEVGVPIVVDATLSSDDSGSDFFDGIKIFPNPTNDFFSVELDSFSNRTIYIEVYDQLGRKIHSDLIANTDSRATTISMNGFESGAYIVRCFSGEVQRSFKLVKL